MDILVESILSEDYVSASELFEARLNDIMERKLYEMKRYIQAEGLGGLTAAQIQARKELGWRKASDVLPDPRDITISIKPKTKKPALKRKKLKEDISRSDVEAEKKRLTGAGKVAPHPFIASQEKERPQPGAFGTKKKPTSPAIKHYDPESEKARQDKLVSIAARSKQLKNLPQAGLARQGTPSKSDRYAADIAQARDLKRRGSKTAVKLVRKKYGRAYSTFQDVKKAAGETKASPFGQALGGVISGLASE
jgi:hypothetical protein